MSYNIVNIVKCATNRIIIMATGAMGMCTGVMGMCNGMYTGRSP